MFRATMFPFAYGPENPFSRQVLEDSENSFTMLFDMATETVPECAGISLVGGNFHEQIHFTLTRGSGDLAFVMLELKDKNKIKYAEHPIDLREGAVTLDIGIRGETSEITFCCFSANNKGKQGKLQVTTN